jgi:hypothetical protein
MVYLQNYFNCSTLGVCHLVQVAAIARQMIVTTACRLQMQGASTPDGFRALPKKLNIKLKSLTFS